MSGIIGIHSPNIPIEKEKKSSSLVNPGNVSPLSAPLPSHHKLCDDVGQLINDVVVDTVGIVEEGIFSYIGNDSSSPRQLPSLSDPPKSSSPPSKSSASQGKPSRVLGAKDLVNSVENRLENDIVNEASPLLHRLEDALVDNDPDETTPSTPENDPLNTLSVRSLRIVLYVLTGLWSTWITLLIVNVFAHIPWLDEPSVSAAFTQLDMALMSLAEVISSLMFYKFPAKADRGVEYVTAGIVLLDLVVVLSVPSQREKNGSRGGLITTIGSLVTFILAPITDRVVEYTKKREQDLVRGDDNEPPPRKSFTDYVRMVSMFCIRGLILLSVALISTNMVIETYDMAFLDPPGQIIPVKMAGNGEVNLNTFYDGNTKTLHDDATINIHIYCTEFAEFAKSTASTTSTSSAFNRPIPPPADTNVTVLVETGESSSYEFSSWMLELYEQGELHQVCYWDRPGFGFSEQAPSPVSAGAIANILFQALDSTLNHTARANTTTPNKYVLVSHGVGGLYSRIFASRHSPSIHSLVLVDTLHEDLFYRRNSPWQGFKYWIQGVYASFGYRNVFNIIFFKQGPFDRIYGTAHRHQPLYFFSKLQEQLSARTTTKSEIIESNAALADDIPVVVISSSKSIRTDKEWSDKQRQLTKLTKNTLAWEVLEGPHDLWKHESSKKQLQQLLLDDINYARRHV